MADVTSSTTLRRVPDPASQSFPIKSAETVYHGRFLGLEGGYVLDYAPGASTLFLGPADAPDGLTEATGDGSKRVSVPVHPYVLKEYDVTGVTAITNVGAKVYGVDNNLLSLTQATNAQEVGYVIRWHSGTSCDVFMFGLSHLLTVEA